MTATTKDDRNSELAKRLRNEMVRKSINARELAKNASVGDSFVYDILSGKSTNPTTKKLSAVAAVLRTSVPYLLYGNETYNNIFPSVPFTISSNEDDLIALPTLGLETYEDGNAVITEEQTEKPHYFHKLWITRKLQSQPENLRVTIIEDDSMSPIINREDMIVIDISKKRPSPSGLFAIYDGLGLAVKRLEYINHPTNPMIHIISDNPKYKDYEREPSHVTVIGKAIWVSRQL